MIRHSALACFLAVHLTPLAAQAPAAHYAERPEVVAFIDTLAREDGFEADELSALFAQAQALPKVIELIRPPADPAIRSWHAYRGRFVEPKRIAAGRRFMARHGTALARAEARWGVPRAVIAGVIGVETLYGKQMGNFGTFNALTTLAFDYPPRAALFRRELRELLLLAREEGRAIGDYRGSYAGALGLPQFLPGSIRKFAVDFDGNGRIDLAQSAEDAIGSVANYLAQHGWRRDEPIATPVTLEADAEQIAAALAAGIEPQYSASEWQTRGLRLEVAKLGAGETAPPISSDLPAALIDFVTPGAATEYRLGHRNFYVITRYNKSTFYAAAVADLAAALP